MNEILFEGIRKDNGEKVIGCLINNMFFYSALGVINTKRKPAPPAPYIIPNDEFEYDCWNDIAYYADDYEVIPESVKQITFLD